MPDPKQYELALKRANEVRIRRAEILGLLKKWDISLEEALSDPAMQGLRVAKMLCAIHRVNVCISRRILGECQATEWTTIGDLGERRAVLLRANLEKRFRRPL